MSRYLVVNPFGIGDVLFSMPLVENLRASDPACRIGFVANERTAGLVRLHRSIDRTFIFDRDRFRGLWKTGKRLFYLELKGLLAAVKEDGYDTLIDLSLGRQYAFFAMMIGISRRAGLDYKYRGLFLTRRKKITGYSKRIADIQLELLPLVGIEPRPVGSSLRVPEEAAAGAVRALTRMGIRSETALAVLTPGGGASWGKDARYKQWDPARFAQVARKLAAEGREVVFAGDASERPLLDQIARGAGLEARRVLAGEPIELVAALMRKAGFVLGNDGGLIHLADALGVRTVAIFGPVDEHAYGPWRTPGAIAVTAQVPCRPCYHRFHFPPCPHHRRCLEEISVEKVLEVIHSISVP